MTKVKHQSNIDDIEKKLVNAFDKASRGPSSYGSKDSEEAMYLQATAELARSIIELRKQREFEALPVDEKRQLKLPSMKTAAS